MWPTKPQKRGIKMTTENIPTEAEFKEVLHVMEQVQLGLTEELKARLISLNEKMGSKFWLAVVAAIIALPTKLFLKD
jgi:hypothetical protein